MNIRKNMKVKVNNEKSSFHGAIGEVIKVYEVIDIAIVRFSDEVIVKIPVDCLLVIEEQNQEGKTEIPDGAKQITKNAFLEALKRVTDPKTCLEANSISDPSFVGNMCAIVICKVITDEIFSGRDVIIVNEEQFIDIFWNECNPVKLSENMSKTIGARRHLIGSMSAIMILEDMIEILFAKDSEECK